MHKNLHIKPLCEADRNDFIKLKESINGKESLYINEITKEIMWKYLFNAQKTKVYSIFDENEEYGGAIENDDEEYYVLPKVCEDIYGSRSFEGDEPLLILLDNGKILSLLADFMDIHPNRIVIREKILKVFAASKDKNLYINLQ